MSEILTQRNSVHSFCKEIGSGTVRVSQVGNPCTRGKNVCRDGYENPLRPFKPSELKPNTLETNFLHKKCPYGPNLCNDDQKS